MKSLLAVPGWSFRWKTPSIETDSILASSATVTGEMIFNDGGRVTFSTSPIDPQNETTVPIPA